MKSDAVDSTSSIPLIGILALSLMVCTGCGPTLSVSKTMELQPNDIRSIIVEPLDYDQEIQVEAKGDEPFHAHVYFLEDEKSIDLSIAMGTEPTKALSGSMDKKTHSFSALVPAKREAAVRLESATGKTVSVELTIRN